MKKPKNITEEIKAIRNDSNARKFTLVLGSGFHKAAIGSSHCLSNWDLLLLQLGSKSCSQKKYILQFEELILDGALLNKQRAAADIEKELLGYVKKILNEETESVDLAKYESLKFLFDSNLVSDVISLNYDSVPEKICKKQINGTGKVIWQNANTDLNEDSRSLQKRTTDYRKIANKAGNSIRFWYPHGNISRRNSVVLGVNKYSQLLVSFDKIRKRYKKMEESYLANHKGSENIDCEAIDLMKSD